MYGPLTVTTALTGVDLPPSHDGCNSVMRIGQTAFATGKYHHATNAAGSTSPQAEYLCAALPEDTLPYGEAGEKYMREIRRIQAELAEHRRLFPKKSFRDSIKPKPKKKARKVTAKNRKPAKKTARKSKLKVGSKDAANMVPKEPARQRAGELR